jgi:uncharacterized protein (DUF1778 family)
MSTASTKSKSEKGLAKPETVSDGAKRIHRKSNLGAFSRFDTRLSLETKKLLERAAAIKGFKSLSEFVIHFSSEAALSIIERHNRVLASDRDQAIFFDALLNPPVPNEELVGAAKQYKAQIEA